MIWVANLIAMRKDNKYCMFTNRMFVVIEFPHKGHTRAICASSTRICICVSSCIGRGFLPVFFTISKQLCVIHRYVKILAIEIGNCSWWRWCTWLDCNPNCASSWLCNQTMAGPCDWPQLILFWSTYCIEDTNSAQSFNNDPCKSKKSK